MSPTTQAPAQGGLCKLYLPASATEWHVDGGTCSPGPARGRGETCLGGGPSFSSNSGGCSDPYHFSELVSTAAFIFTQDKHRRCPVLLLTHSGIIAWSLNCDLLYRHSAVEFFQGNTAPWLKTVLCSFPQPYLFVCKPRSQISCWICSNINEQLNLHRFNVL